MRADRPAVRRRKVITPPSVNKGECGVASEACPFNQESDCRWAHDVNLARPRPCSPLHIHRADVVSTPETSLRRCHQRHHKPGRQSRTACPNWRLFAQRLRYGQRHPGRQHHCWRRAATSTRVHSGRALMPFIWLMRRCITSTASEVLECVQQAEKMRIEDLRILDLIRDGNQPLLWGVYLFYSKGSVYGGGKITVRFVDRIPSILFGSESWMNTL